jgi:O-antigen/teichoic acid export membrane protein
MPNTPVNHSRPGPPHSGRHSLARNFLALAASRGLQAASGFFVLLAAARLLPVEAFGRLGAVSALAGALVALTYFGVQQVMIREMVCNRAGAREILGRAMVLRGALAVAAGAGVALAGWWSGYDRAMFGLLALAFALEVCRSFGMLGCAVFQAHERMGYETPLAAIAGLASMGLTGLGLYLGYGPAGVLGGLLGATALHAVLTWRVAVRLTRPAFDGDRRALRAMFAASSVVGLGVFFQQNLFRAGTLSLSWWADLTAVADFQAPHEFLLKLEIVPQALMLAVFPALARLAPTDFETARRLFRLLFRHTLQGMALPAILLAFYADPACLLLFGGKYAGAAAVMRLVALALPLLALDMLVNNLLVAIGRQRYAMYYAGAALVLAFAANAALAPRYGALGAAGAALCSYGWLLFFATRCAARHGYTTLGLRPAVRTACAAMACLGACFLLKHAPALGALAGAAVYGAVILGLKGVTRADFAELRQIRQAGRTAAAKEDTTCR